MVQFHSERPQVFSVTPEAAASLSFQAPPPRSARPDPLQGNDRFQALIDSSAPSDTGNDRASTTAQQPASPRRADDTRAAADSKRSRDAAPANQSPANNSQDRDATASRCPHPDARP